MPRRVSALGVTAYWSDTRFPKYFTSISRYGDPIIQRWQRERRMNKNELSDYCTMRGITAVTGDPHIGKERKFVHGREIVIVHMRGVKLSIASKTAMSPEWVLE